MKKICLITLGFFILFSICGCGRNSIKGKTFINEDLSVYYTDRNGNKLEYDKDTYNYSEIEKQIKEGYTTINYIKYKTKYSFITNSVVKYEYIKNGSTIKSYNCEYSIEEDMIKVKCNNDIELFSYNEDNCIVDNNNTEYCVE